MTELGGRGLAFGYEVVNEGGAVLAQGTTRHVFADINGKLRRAPAEIVGALEAFRSRET